MFRPHVSFARVGALALAVCLLPATATAQHGPPGPRPGAHGRGEMADRIMDRLDLTAEQREAVQALHEELQAGTSGAREQLAAARAALFESIHAIELDETAIRKAAAEVARIEADLAVERAQGFQQFRALLTPEQQKELDSIQETIQMLHAHGGDLGFGPHGPGDF